MAGLDEEFEARWHREAEAVMSGMKEWRLQYPKATFREIEAAVDEKLSGMRARLLEDLALASRAADLQDKQAGEQPHCPSLRASAGEPGQAGSHHPHPWRRRGALEARLRALPGLWGRSFPPSMRNWNSCLGH